MVCCPKVNFSASCSKSQVVAVALKHVGNPWIIMSEVWEICYWYLVCPKFCVSNFNAIPCHSFMERSKGFFKSCNYKAGAVSSFSLISWFPEKPPVQVRAHCPHSLSPHIEVLPWVQNWGPKCDKILLFLGTSIIVFLRLGRSPLPQPHGDWEVSFTIP